MAQNENTNGNTPVKKKTGFFGFLSGVKAELKKV